MPLFVLSCIDKANSLEVRMAAREAHLAFIAEQAAKVRLAGPVLGASGDMAGSLLILDVPDLAAAQAFSAQDPYTKAGLWDHVDLHEFRITRGGV
jgi:hypothetical protein